MQRSLSTGQIPPPENEITSSSNGKTLAAGLFVALTGAAVYYYRDLFHQYPAHPIILHPRRPLQTLNGVDSESDSTLFEPMTATKSFPESSVKGSKYMREIPSEQDGMIFKGERERIENNQSVQIIDNSPIVGLFAEALGPNPITKDSSVSSSGIEKSIFWNRVFVRRKQESEV